MVNGETQSQITEEQLQKVLSGETQQSIAPKEQIQEALQQSLATEQQIQEALQPKKRRRTTRRAPTPQAPPPIMEVAQPEVVSTSITQEQLAQVTQADLQRQQTQITQAQLRQIQPTPLTPEEQRIRSFEQRAKALAQRKEEFATSPRVRRIEQTASLITRGGLTPIEQRSTIGRFSQEVVTGLLSPILLPEAVILAGGTIAGTLEALTIPEAREEVRAELRRAGEETIGIVTKPSTLFLAAFVALPGTAAGQIAKGTKFAVKGKTKAKTVKQEGQIESVIQTKGTVAEIVGGKVKRITPFDEKVILTGRQQKPSVEARVPRERPIKTPETAKFVEERALTLSEVQAAGKGDGIQTFTDVKAIDITKQVELAKIETPRGEIRTGIGEAETFTKIGQEARISPDEFFIRQAKPEARTQFTFTELGKETKIRGITEEVTPRVVSRIAFEETITKIDQPREIILSAEPVTRVQPVTGVKPEATVGLQVITSQLSLTPTTKALPGIGARLVVEQPKPIQVTEQKPVVTPAPSQPSIAKEVTEAKTLPVQKPVQETIFIPIQEPQRRTARRPRDIVITEPKPIQEEIVSPIQDIAPTQAQISVQEQFSLPRQAVVPREQFIPITTPREARSEFIRPKFFPDLEPGKARPGIAQDLILEVGRPGRQIFFTEQVGSIEQAFQRGRLGVEQTAAATFKIKTPTGEEILFEEEEITRRLGSTFRAGAMGGIVQRREARIGTLGEKLDITAKGIAARTKGFKL